MRKPTIYFAIDRKLKKGEHAGKYHVRMWVTFKHAKSKGDTGKGWTQVTYKTGIYCNEKEFPILNDWNLKKLPFNVQALRDKLEPIRDRAKTIIDEYNITDQKEFETYFLSKYSTDSVALEFQNKIAELEANNQFGSKKTYENALQSFQKFFRELMEDESYDFTFSDCTAENLYKYEDWFLSQDRSPKNPDGRKNSITTVGFYMLPLRHIFNRKINAKQLSREMYPFGIYKGQYTIPTGGQTVAQFLEIDEMEKFKNWHHASDELTTIKIIKQNKSLFNLRALSEYAEFNKMEDFEQAKILKCYALEKIQERNRLYAYAKFSYYAYGININDICRLKRSQIFKDHILINRQKITRRNRKNRQIMIPLLPIMQDIINQYGKRSLAPNDYVFPILNLEMNGEEIHEKIQETVNEINKVLAQVSKELKLSIKVTTYKIRHSFAWALKQMDGYTLELLGDSLGHLDPRTTKNYDHKFSLGMKKKFSDAL